jgi:hypothetical protein
MWSETDPVSETLCYLRILEFLTITRSRNPVILRVINHRQNPLESTWSVVTKGAIIASMDFPDLFSLLPDIHVLFGRFKNFSAFVNIHLLLLYIHLSSVCLAVTSALLQSPRCIYIVLTRSIFASKALFCFCVFKAVHEYNLRKFSINYSQIFSKNQ